MLFTFPVQLAYQWYFYLGVFLLLYSWMQMKHVLIIIFCSFTKTEDVLKPQLAISKLWILFIWLSLFSRCNVKFIKEITPKVKNN